ncbi:MAG TPA: hypothetical protein VFV79_10780 [Saprospiraceae bacterium]|nr:hypothetical protein [Saprospiraceae bacterium]
MKLNFVFLLFFLMSFVADSGAQSIGQTTITFVDESRSRKLVTELWYPTKDQATPPESKVERDVFKPYYAIRDAKPTAKKFPLILLSHGTGGGRLTLSWLATGLAKEGFIVAAVDHWGNTFDNPIPEYFIKFWERPQDLSFILTNLLKNSNWSAFIDEQRVGAVGFSLGGYTVISSAGGKMDCRLLTTFTETEEGKKEANIPEMPGLLERFKVSDFSEDYDVVKEKLHDSRIKCIVAMCPAIGQGFDKNGLSGIKIPVLIVGAQMDSIAPVKTNASYYAQYISGARLELLNAGHYTFLNECTDFGREVASVICSDAESIDRQAIHDKALQLMIPFLKYQLK